MEIKDMRLNRYLLVHARVYAQLIEKYMADKCTDSLGKLVYHGILFVNLEIEDNGYDFLGIPIEKVQEIFTLIQSVNIFIKKTTPNELMRVFSVDKTYDAEKSLRHDYFTMMDALKKHGLDTPFGESMFNILMGYPNNQIHIYTSVAFLMAQRFNSKLFQNLANEHFDNLDMKIRTAFA